MGGAHLGMKNKAGHLVLAGHSDRVEFRNMKIADYSVSPATHVSQQDNVPPSGFKTLFNGEDLQGWKGLAHKNANSRRELKGDAATQAQMNADKVMREHWSVVEGILTYDGKGQSLCTGKDYGDFEMYIDWKIPAGADSGIYLRGTPQIQIWDPWDLRMKPKKDGSVDGPGDLTTEQWVAAYKNGRNLGSGGLWNNRRWRNSPTVLADKKPGEWNRFLIRMVGDNVTIWFKRQENCRSRCVRKLLGQERRCSAAASRPDRVAASWQCTLLQKSLSPRIALLATAVVKRESQRYPETLAAEA